MLNRDKSAHLIDRKKKKKKKKKNILAFRTRSLKHFISKYFTQKRGNQFKIRGKPSSLVKLCLVMLAVVAILRLSSRQ